MPFSDYLAERVRARFANLPDVGEKKMMGGLIFMVNDKMCVGVDVDRKTGEDRIMARIGPDAYDKHFGEGGTRPMDFTGKPMKGFIFVYSDGIDSEEDLDKWVQRALDFNSQIPDKK